MGWSLVAEYSVNVSLSLRRSYTWGPDISGSMGGAGGTGGLLAIETWGAGATTYLATHDGRGNIVAYYDAAQNNLALALEYDPFGRLIRQDYRDATVKAAFEGGFPAFASKTYETETGLSFYGFRYYTPELGRFVNRDPLEERGGWTLYKNVGFGTTTPFHAGSNLGGHSWHDSRTHEPTNARGSHRTN